MRANIQFIYFDIGGVLIEDFYGNGNKWPRMLQQLGITDSNRMVFDELWTTFSPHLNIDRDVDDMLPQLRQAGINIPEKFSLLTDGFVHNFHENRAIWPILKRLDPHRCGILSNMYPRMYEAIIREGILPAGVDKWPHIVQSAGVGMQKPNNDIYEHAATQAGVPTAELLFVDNMELNLKTAGELGWQTFLWNSYDHEQAAKDFVDFLENETVLGFK